MRKIITLHLLLKRFCLISLAFTVPMKAPASPDCCASWAIAGAVIWGGGMACGAVSLCAIEGGKALSKSCSNCFQSLYEWIDKKEEEEEPSSQSRPLLGVVKSQPKSDTLLPSIIYEPTREEEKALQDFFIQPLSKSPSKSSLFESDED